VFCNWRINRYSFRRAVKPIKNLALAIVSLASLCCCMVGCGRSTDVVPLANGYEEITYTRQNLSEPDSHQITLQFRNPKNKLVMVWPSVEGPIVKDDLAVFVGNVDYRAYVFAVRAPEAPLEITPQVISCGVKKAGGYPAKRLTATIAYLTETNGLIEFAFGTTIPPDYTDLTVQLNWNEISNIMYEVKEKGVVCKDQVSGMSYIEREF